MPTNYTPSQVYDKYVALQKQLATNITNKGVTASQTELYDNLIDKVAQIENLKGEERTLENFTNVLSEPKSVVQLKYPDNTPKTLNAKLGSKNLIPYPYADTSSTMFGVTFTVNSDGSVTVNGTATANVIFELERSEATMFVLPAGNYFLSGCPSGGSLTSYFMAAANGAGISYDKFQRDFGNGISVPSKGEKWKVSIRIMSGYTADNLVFKPQIELGSTATAYTPYISDFSTVKVTRCGKNLTTPQQVYNGATAYSEEIFENKNCVRFSSGKTIKNSPIAFKPNTQYTVSFDVKTILRSGQTTSVADNVFCFFYDDDTFSVIANIYTQTDWVHKVLTSTVGKTVVAVGLYITEYRSYSYVDIDSFQLEEGSTVTEYEPYQGQTYTSTATGEVTGITNLYPTTTLLTNNAGVVFEQVTGGAYKEILPSTDKMV